ncbi:glycosyltransferase family 1 protein [Halorubrum sp. Atlit-8R]|uniref:glycosyltransferase family 4 protein n=1 Tax=unclassified Halorubrum TaxID=2642239 RepID=UPI000EF23E09|nr:MULTISPECIES: glycosyltransferase [unclassified Halorubrum]RLM71602.1 glycosyltransferase family 1 protein [Halorubrum sp. Atlit-9R]RLM82243.1 glycosyltransferase family 1 protein [Halorubrum sp. Atlit-8R]
MTKVLLFTPKYPPSRGGAATFYSNITEEQYDNTTFIVVTSLHNSRGLIEQKNGITVYSLLPRIERLHRYIRVPLEILVLILVSSYLILSKKIDLIHSHSSSFSVVGLSIVSVLFRTPIVNDCRDETFRPWIVKLGLTPLWFSCASNIDDILIQNGVPKDNIKRLPVVNPDYVKEYRSTNTPDELTDLIYIGTLRKPKGIFLLADAIKILHQQGMDIDLTVVGDGPDRSKFENKCQNNGIEDCVTLTGSLNHNDTLRRLTESDALVLPSESEGVPRVVLEAQDVGTPAVATAVGGIPDVIDHEKTGMLTEQTPESIAENVLRLIHDDELYRMIVESGVESADERSWERVGGQLREGYDRANKK